MDPGTFSMDRRRHTAQPVSAGRQVRQLPITAQVPEVVKEATIAQWRMGQ